MPRSRSSRLAIAAIVGALLFQSAFVLFGTLVPDAGGLFGAPLVAGKSSGLFGSIVSLGGSTEWWSTPFAVDVLITAVALWGAGRIGGMGAIAFALVGAVIAFLSVPVALFASHNISEPWTPPGFPFAAASDTRGAVDRMALLGDSVFGAVVAFGIWLALRRWLPTLRPR